MGDIWAQEGPKMAPRALRERPWSDQDASKRLPGLQDASKRPPELLWSSPGTPQASSRTLPRGPQGSQARRNARERLNPPSHLPCEVAKTVC